MPEKKAKSYTANSLVRGLEILSLFDHKNSSLNLSEIASIMGITSSAVYRYVVTLENEGFLSKQTNGKQYKLAARVMDLGFRYIKSLDISEIAEPYIKNLRNITDFTAHVSVLENTEIVYIYRALSERSLVSNIPVGSRLPAHATSMGRLMLSGLSDQEIIKLYKKYKFPALTEHAPRDTETLLALIKKDRELKYVAQRSHLASDTFVIAYPILSSNGEIVGAINISGHEQQLKADQFMIDAVAKAANEISAFL
ncbi:IclR family transcriptional regulator [Kiloniella antarctica]|uniref:IclR family transcriptional regulator n=1 Tax=Kiloniella antarctica TaxID=1550907 RepID=A0ABW5BPZ7_9PROT